MLARGDLEFFDLPEESLLGYRRSYEGKLCWCSTIFPGEGRTSSGPGTEGGEGPALSYDQ